MPRKFPLLWVAAVPLAYVLYIYGLGTAGLLGPDEPRYASIAREMANSGDWVTPRLWGQPWFEKPALFYWLAGAAFKLGLGPEMAPRLPIAMFAIAFLAFYWWALRREFGESVAWFATLILGTTAGWIGFSQVGVTDLPLAAAFSASMLLALPWIARRDTRQLPAAAACLGLAVLAKGLVPLVLAVPLLYRARLFRDLLRPRVVAPFLAVALPWYLLCYRANGWEFIRVFFVEHHFSRFTSDALQHPQPWWFYLPVLVAGMLPWSPLLALVARRAGCRDPRRLFLLALLLFGLAFFSASTNKLPGYLLPLLPAAAALMALGLEESSSPGALLAGCALLLAAFPVAVPVLPAALASGLSRAPLPAFHWTWLLPAAVAVAAWLLARAGKRATAVLVVTVAAAAGVGFLKRTALPEIDRSVSARMLWRQIADRAAETCVDPVRRSWRYGLNYYSVVPLPDCVQDPQPLRVRELPGQAPELTGL